MGDAPARWRILNPGDVGMPTQPVTDPEIVTDALAIAKGLGLNVLCSIDHVQHIPVDHHVTVRVIYFDDRFTDQQLDDRSNDTWYITKSGKLALTRSSLDQISSAVNARWIARDCYREDDYRIKNVWTVRMTGCAARPCGCLAGSRQERWSGAWKTCRMMPLRF